MAWQLFRLGRWSFIHRKLVAGVWIVVLALVGIGAATLAGTPTDEFELSGIESTEAFELIEERSADASPDGATARVVFEAPQGQSLTDPANQKAIHDALSQLEGTDVASVADPFTSGTLAENGRVAYATVTFNEAAADLAESDTEALESVKDVAADAELGVAIGGDALSEAAHAPLAELIGIGIAFIVLALTLGSLVAAGMPLLTAVIGVGVGMLSITTLTGFVELSSTTPALGTMLGLAVGVDYALFIMARYQAEARKGGSLEEAAGRAVGTAGSAVVFAGLTVIIALAGLAVCGIPFLTQMGLAGAFTVAIAVFIALTLLPAVLGFAGARVALGRRKPKLGDVEVSDPAAADAHGTATGAANGRPVRTLGRRWVDLVNRFKWLMLVGGVSVAAIVSIPLASIELALPDDSTKAADSDARIAYELIADNFGEGANGPLVVVVDTQGAENPVGAVAKATDKIQALAARDGSHVASVISPLADGDAEARQALTQQLDAVSFTNITVIPTTGPSAQEAKDLVADLRAATSDLQAQTGARALVSGQTTVGVDIATELANVCSRSTCSSLSGWPSSCSSRCSARFWYRSRPRSASCSRSAFRSARQ